MGCLWGVYGVPIGHLWTYRASMGTYGAPGGTLGDLGGIWGAHGAPMGQLEVVMGHLWG